MTDIIDGDSYKFLVSHENSGGLDSEWRPKKFYAELFKLVIET
jgi:hypothetical protein